MRIFWPVRTGVMALVINRLILFKAGELWLPKVRSQFSSPKAVMLQFILFMWTSKCVMSCLTSSGSQKIGTMQVEHQASNIAMSENVMPLIIEVVLMNVDCNMECYWRLNM